MKYCIEIIFTTDKKIVLSDIEFDITLVEIFKYFQYGFQQIQLSHINIFSLSDCNTLFS